jgi:hypothetical protein
MNCRDVTRWLLAGETAATPDAVKQHLVGCRGCRRRARRRLRLDQAVAALPCPPDNPAARARILEKIAASAAPRPAVQAAAPRLAVPTRATVAPPLPTRLAIPRRRWRGWLARAALLLVVLGGTTWAVVRLSESEPEEQPLRASTADGERLLSKLIEDHVQLAEGQPPEKRALILVEMAADLRGESFRLAQAHADAELPAVAELYERVVRDGLVKRAKHLPAAQRQALRSELRQTQFDASRLAASASPRAAEALRQVAATARQAEQELAGILEGAP